MGDKVTYEIEPMRRDDQGPYISRLVPAQFWGLYRRVYVDHEAWAPAEHIADFETENEAIIACNALNEVTS